MISFLILATLACRALLSAPTPTPLPSSTPTSTATQTATPTARPSATAQPSATASPSPTPLAQDGFFVRYHPDNALYVGDLVSLEVISPPGMALHNAQLSVQVDESSSTIGPTSFDGWGIARRQQATMLWAWDTTGLAAGEHTLSFSVQPQGITWAETVTLQPAEALPVELAQASWAKLQTDCCNIYYLTDTATERDLQSLAILIEEQAQHAASQMGINFTERVGITILPRLLGHGGFATDEIQVSYLDRNYAANDWDLVLHHEMIHILDNRLGGDLLPTIFIEGLAVYASGGHYKPEPLMERCSVLLDPGLDSYLPLQPLADDFYASQHEIGYLQAGALVEYMVGQYGWEAFSAFYRDIHPAPGGKQSEAIDVALQRHFALSFAQLEQDFIAALESLPDSPDWVEDVAITVSLYNTLRRYQGLLDPSAYFRTAWLLDSKQMRQLSITADYLRHPDAAENLALETMLVAAGEDLDFPPYPQAAELLASANAVLDEIEKGASQPFKVTPLAEDYYALILFLTAAGYEPQKMVIEGSQAYAYVGSGSTSLQVLELHKTVAGWSLK